MPLTVILRRRNIKKKTRSKRRFWVRDIFTRIEQHGEFHCLVQELKLGLCRKEKDITSLGY